MSNLHKDLANDQIHNPKDFSTAANDTKLIKNASGNLEWVANSGGGGGVTQITAGTGVTISPVGGTGNVTINSTATGGVSSIVAGTGISISPPAGMGAVTITNAGRNYVNHNFEGSAVNMATGTEWGIGNAQYNSEHKFTINLGSPAITTISPKNAVSSSVWVAGEEMDLVNWSGWIWGGNGTQVTLSLLRVKMPCPFPTEEAPASVDICRLHALNLTLTGNNTPVCWNVGIPLECGEGWAARIQPNEIIACSAYTSSETATFVFNNNMQFQI